MKPLLTAEALREEAASFAEVESSHVEPTLYGVTDGKAVGTYLEHKFRDVLSTRYDYEPGSSASGIDFPSVNVDMKVTSHRQPQSSSPFKSARQKVLGLGYALLVFVYEKTDDDETRTANLRIAHSIFVEESCTADYQMTREIRRIIDDNGNAEDIAAFMLDRNLPLDEDQAMAFAHELLESPPVQGYLTVSNALQWRLQYKRAIEQAGQVAGIFRVR